jgi:hypothetical protein
MPPIAATELVESPVAVGHQGRSHDVVWTWRLDILFAADVLTGD